MGGGSILRFEIKEELFTSSTWEKIKAHKVRFAQKAAQQMEGAVRSAVGGTGKVAGWQKGRYGEGGGYAAVSPVTGVSHKGYPVGYITGAVDAGHRIRPPGKSRSRVKKARVPGRHFYRQASGQLEAIAASAVSQLEAEIASVLEEAAR